MKKADVYLFIFAVTLLLAMPIIRAIRTLLAMRARVAFPLLRMQGREHRATMITAARNLDVIVCPHCASSFDRHIDPIHTTLAQPREVL